MVCALWNMRTMAQTSKNILVEMKDIVNTKFVKQSKSIGKVL